MDASRAFEISTMMTDGEKWNIFVLDLSFLGWNLLGSLLLGIGVLFVQPYTSTTNAELYAAMRAKVIASGYVTEAELQGASHRFLIRKNGRIFMEQEMTIRPHAARGLAPGGRDLYPGPSPPNTPPSRLPVPLTGRGMPPTSGVPAGDPGPRRGHRGVGGAVPGEYALVLPRGGRGEHLCGGSATAATATDTTC